MTRYLVVYTDMSNRHIPPAIHNTIMETVRLTPATLIDWRNEFLKSGVAFGAFISIIELEEETYGGN